MRNDKLDSFCVHQVILARDLGGAGGGVLREKLGVHTLHTFNFFVVGVASG